MQVHWKRRLRLAGVHDGGRFLTLPRLPMGSICYAVRESFEPSRGGSLIVD